MPVVTMKELLEAGVHYGHHTSRWNPKMARYIFKERHSIHIVDLRQTVRGLARAKRFLEALAEQGGEVVLVGTKKQARAVVEEQARRAGIPYVAERWLGGSFTNFGVVMGRVKRLNELEKMQETGDIEIQGKKYASVLRREMAKLQRNLGGIRFMTRPPEAVVIIDPRRERNALREACTLGIPAICFLDTDCDPDTIDVVIPGNDDAMRSIHLICSKLMDAILEGKSKRPMTQEAAFAAEQAQAAAAAVAPAAAAPVAAAPAPEAAAQPATVNAPAASPAPEPPQAPASNT